MKNYLKIVTFIFLLSILSSCVFFDLKKHFENQNLTFNYNKKQYFKIGKKNLILVKIKMNNKGEQTLFFDTRAPDMIFRESETWRDSLPILTKLPDFFNPTVGDGKQINSKFAGIDTASFDLFSAKDWVVNLIDMNWTCNDIIGILGNRVFYIYKSKLEINFDDNYLSIIDNISADFTEIKSEFSGNTIDIYLSINGIKYLFGLDTGFNSSMILKLEKDDETNKYLKHQISTYGATFIVAGGGIINDTTHTKIADKIYLDKTHYVENLEIKLMDGKAGNLIGIDFIKHYNWLLDYENAKVYIQKRKTKAEPESPSFYRDILGCVFAYKSDPITVNLLSVNGRAEKAGLLLGDEVLSFNGVNILDTPMCERSSKVIKILKEKEKVVLKIKRNDKILDIEF